MIEINVLKNLLEFKGVQVHRDMKRPVDLIDDEAVAARQLDVTGKTEVEVADIIIDTLQASHFSFYALHTDDKIILRFGIW